MVNRIYSRKYALLIAFVCAIVFHAGIALLKFDITPVTQTTQDQSISIWFQPPNDPPIEETQPPVEITENKTPQEPIELTEKPEQKTIIANNNQIDPQVTITTITNSAEFKQWIKQETEQYIERNPYTLDEFTQSFELPTIETKPQIKKDISPLKTGDYATVVNGKVTCHIQTILPFQNDFSSNIIHTSKDCTPKKKFTLNIN